MTDPSQQPNPQKPVRGWRAGGLVAWIEPIQKNAIRDVTAGFVASIILIANIISFGALMFPGELSSGIPTAIWSMLVGSCLGGVFIALATSLPPLATGIDSPTGAVLVLLGGAVSHQVLAGGGSAETAILTSMLLFSCATFLSGASLYLLGSLRWGGYFRFVPYSVVAGFLAATGLFLILGGTRTAIGRSLTSNPFSNWTQTDATKLCAAVAVLAVLLSIRRWSKSGLVMPAALLLMWLAGSLVLRFFGLFDAEHGWYLPALGPLSSWSLYEALQSVHFTRSEILVALPEVIAVALVAVVSLVTKVASLELARQVPGDLNREFRAHGLGNLIATPFGGIASSLQTGTSRLLEHACGATRMSGVVSSAVLGAVALTNFNLAGMIPVPIIVGLVFFLGCTFVVDALWRPYAQRAWLDLTLALAIMAVCVLYGYLVGVFAGVICACVLFAVSYARRGVVRRHATRAKFASYVTRPVETSKYLREMGSAIQIYWLSGHIFFGSSESLFERVRSDIANLPPGQVSYVILDFEMISGADTSSIVSITKLRDFCAKRGITLVYSSPSASVETSLRRGGCLENSKSAFSDLNLALAWCEEQLLGMGNVNASAGFEEWLLNQMGSNVVLVELLAYFEMKSTTGSEVIYHQGDAADTLDLVADGTLVVDVADERGASVRVRRINTHSVVGEMGFFRRSMRSATVSSDGPAKLFTLTHARFDQMRRDRPDLASAFADFILCTMADRIESANRSVAALSR